MNWFFRYALPLVGLAAGFGAFIGLLAAETFYFLPVHVVPPGGEDLTDWLDAFRASEWLWVLYPTIGCASAWHVLSVAKTSYRGDQRSIWFMLWALAAVLAILCVNFAVPREENGIGLWATMLTILNGIVVFWLATVPFSTITHKFAPFGSQAIRKLY